MEQILLSQLIALIACTHETNRVQIMDGDLAWRRCNPFKFEGRGHHNLSIKWDRGCGCGSLNPYLCMTMISMQYDHYSFPRGVFHAYYYNGDNCNERTRFIYKIMADDTEIVDDIGIVGHGGEIGRTYLTKLKPSEYSKIMVNARGRRAIYDHGWKYETEKG